MNSTNWLLKFDLDCEAVITYAQRQLAAHDIRLVRSFDLKSACATYPEFTCPHHGDAPCDCQMVVLLAYSKNSPPASLVVHSHRGQTEIEMVNSPNHPPQPELVEAIMTALEPGTRYAFSFREWAEVNEE